ncbi:hypothetical protein KC614_03355 [candidate division WWE3 bacterium]|uniref:Uncharacterized protein n=1 Tax=candidate division WWE3 bacterium TaxID=2053526 RepID=A0A955LL01_UNCKA|nr:hypothetical protein [candidate division WWE3 bacterium]
MNRDDDRLLDGGIVLFATTGLVGFLLMFLVMIATDNKAEWTTGFTILFLVTMGCLAVSAFMSLMSERWLALVVVVVSLIVVAFSYGPYAFR